MKAGAETKSSGGGSFPTTHWSLVLNAATGDESEAHQALEALCRRYWFPLYAYARRHGRTHHEAEDCTQEFLARLLAAEGIGRAKPERGRFRTFLLAAMQNFLRDEWRRAVAVKRGGAAVRVSFDADEDQDRFTGELADGRMTPEQAFDRAWARRLVDRAVADLRDEYGRRGQAPLFAVLVPILWGSADATPHAEHAHRLGMNEHAFTVALQRLRRRCGERLRAAVAETVATPADIDPELRYLIASLGKQGG